MFKDFKVSSPFQYQKYQKNDVAGGNEYWAWNGTLHVHKEDESGEVEKATTKVDKPVRKPVNMEYIKRFQSGEIEDEDKENKKFSNKYPNSETKTTTNHDHGGRESIWSRSRIIKFFL